MSLNDKLWFDPILRLIGKITYPLGNAPIPLNQWIGYKFVCRAYSQSIKCHMELWLDMTNGAGGGNWVLANKVDDVPGLTGGSNPECAPSHNSSGSNPAGTPGSYWFGQPLVHQYQTANYSVLLRCDGTDKQYFKWFSVREVGDIVG